MLEGGETSKSGIMVLSDVNKFESTNRYEDLLYAIIEATYQMYVLLYLLGLHNLIF